VQVGFQPSWAGGGSRWSKFIFHFSEEDEYLPLALLSECESIDNTPMKYSVLIFALSLGMTALPPMASAQHENSIDQRFYAALAEAAKNAAPKSTKNVGGGGGGDFIDALEVGAILVGFKVWQGDYSGHRIIRGIQPIFQTASGRLPGDVHGEEDGAPTTIEAKDGYAVAAIEARGGDRLDGLEVLFWKIHAVDVSLDAEGSYKSHWIGGKGGYKRRHPLTANGSPVIGISGASGSDVDRVGLIYCERH
jgi:hypothetical protein